MTDQNTLEQRVAVLESRVRELEDDREIRQLLSRYGFNADQGRSEEWVDLFTENGALEVALPRAWSAGVGDSAAAGPDHESSENDTVVRHEGSEALRSFILDPDLHKAIEGMSLHILDHNLLTTIDGDAATAESYNVTLVRRGSQMTLFNASINRWTLARVHGAWKIEECRRRRPGAPGFESVLVTKS
jgi:hypothetical protein